MRRLLETFVPHVYRFALRLTGDRHDAEDLTQEVMLRAWRDLRQLRSPDSARIWLFRITINLWKDVLRKRGKTPRVADLAGFDPQDDSASPALQIVQRDELQRAMTALDALPARQRDVLYLHVCEGLTLAEITGVLGIRYEAVKASLSVGRKRMRNALKDLYQEIDGSAAGPD